VKNHAIGALLKQLNPNTIDITKVLLSMPLKNEEEKNHYAFLQQEVVEK
jgi:hypothetical protein